LTPLHFKGLSTESEHRANVWMSCDNVDRLITTDRHRRRLLTAVRQWWTAMF